MEKNVKGRVIVTYGRSLMALTAAHSLHKRDIEVIGSDDVNMTVLSFSNTIEDYFTYAPYDEDEEGFINDLCENIKKFKPEDDRPYILMPMFKDMKIIARHKEKFKDLITVATPDINCINKVTPKDVFAKTCQELDLPIPETFIPQSEDDLENIANKLGFPLLIKPGDDVGGRGIHKIEDMPALQQHYKESFEHYGSAPLLQEIIDGKDYCLSVICEQGKIKASMAYKNLHQFPRKTGAGIMRETIDDRPFLASAERLLQSLEWNGIAQIDFRWSGNPEDKAYLIEVNPRFWAGLFHSVKSGVDFPWLLYQLSAHGKITEKQKAIIGRQTRIPALSTLSALHDIIESETHFDKLQDTWKDIWRETNDAPWQEKLKNITHALHETIDVEDAIKKISAFQKDVKNAKNELSFEDDGFAGFGILFVVSSLVKHGKLPPELTF